MNAAGETVYSGTAVCGTRYLFYSAADISSGESYSIGSMTATAQTGTATTGMGGSPGGTGGETGGKSDGRMGALMMATANLLKWATAQNCQKGQNSRNKRKATLAEGGFPLTPVFFYI